MSVTSCACCWKYVDTDLETAIPCGIGLEICEKCDNMLDACWRALIWKGVKHDVGYDPSLLLTDQRWIYRGSSKDFKGRWALGRIPFDQLPFGAANHMERVA